MFSWIPVLGPILQSLMSSATTLYSKYKDTELGKYQTDAQVAQSANQVTIAFKDDYGLKVLRDLLITPVVAWSALSFWDKIVEHRYADLVWETHGFTQSSPLAYLPHMVFVFLLGAAWINNRK